MLILSTVLNGILRSGNDAELNQQIASKSKVLNYKQLMDHFNNTNLETFDQKYIVNEEFCLPTNDSCPIFVHIGGESPLPDTALDGLKYSNYYFGKELGALTIALEHRFYGKSFPSKTNLSLLSSRQALADLARFIAFVKQQYNKPNSKVIVQGGSYPGAMAAWMRSQFPHLVDVALSSSGPVLAENNYFNYLKHIQAQYDKHGCQKELGDTLLYIKDKILNTPNAFKFKQAFNVTEEIDLEHLSGLKLTNVLEAVVDGLASIVQYAEGENFDHKGNPSEVKQFCTNLTKAETDDEKMQVLGKNNDLSKTTLDYDKFIFEMKTDPMKRAWYYQTCTEFGYYQTSDYEKTIFYNEINMDYFVGICKEAFFDEMLNRKITMEEAHDIVQQRIDYTNAFYGARNIPRSKIYYTNGKVDPWSELGIVKELNWNDNGQYLHEDTVVEWIEEGSHCTDMNINWKINDELRQRQLDKIREWIK